MENNKYEEELSERINELKTMVEATELSKKIEHHCQRIDILEKEISERRQDAKVNELEEERLQSIIDDYYTFNKKHRLIFKLLRFIDRIKLPRITIDWRR